jgi:hypothetical protein
VKPISQQIKSFTSTSYGLAECSVNDIRLDVGLEVNTYQELIGKLAELTFENPDFVLLYRGQSADFKDNAMSTIAPSMYRPRQNLEAFYSSDVQGRYSHLVILERNLTTALASLPY